MIIGSHVSYGKEGLLGSVLEALSYGANTFMFYTGAPQNTIRKEIDEELTNKAHILMRENNIDINKVICHAPYIINLANNIDEAKYQFSINFLIKEIDRCVKLGVKYIVVHPGSSVGIPKNEALDNIVNALKIILKQDSKVMILLETMAGKGTECGSLLEEIKYILDNVNNKNLGVCLDTCHLNDAGYDISFFSSFLNMFNSIIGIDKIKCIHINDSKNNIGTHKDRHENIGYGTIGFSNLLSIVNNKELSDIPKILETPYLGEDKLDKRRIYPPYKYEIKMFKEGIFNNNLLEDVKNEYKKIK